VIVDDADNDIGVDDDDEDDEDEDDEADLLGESAKFEFKAFKYTLFVKEGSMSMSTLFR
jgi:hypothetical protein